MNYSFILNCILLLSNFTTYSTKHSVQENMSSDFEKLRVLTIDNPWAYLIMRGKKVIENRPNKLPSDWIGCPVLIHASKKRINKTEREKTYELVEQMLKTDKEFWHFPLTDFVSFDQLMSNNFNGKILCVVRFDETDIDATDGFASYNFYDIPNATRYHWRIGRRYVIDPAFDGWTGKQGFKFLSPSLTLKLLESKFDGKMLDIYNAVKCNTQELERYIQQVCKNIYFLLKNTYFLLKIHIFCLKIPILSQVCFSTNTKYIFLNE